MQPGFPNVRASVSVLMLFMVTAFFARSWFQVFLRQSGVGDAVAYDLSFFVMLPIALILMWPIMRQNVSAMRRWFTPPQSWWRLITYSVVIGVTLRIIYWAYHTAGIAFGWFHNEAVPIVATPQFWFSCPPAPVLALSILVIAVLTPVFEEFIHRGFVFHALLPRGNALAIFLSAVFFGVMHNTPKVMIMAFLIGLLLAALTLNLRTLWGPIMVHASFNLAAALDWDCLHPNWSPAEPTPQLVVAGAVSTVIMLLGIALVLWLIRYGKAGTQLSPRP